MEHLYSHPNKLLKNHLINVYELGMKKFRSKNTQFKNIEKIELVTRVVLITHDFGKGNKWFQRKIELKMSDDTDSEEYKKLNANGNNDSNHSLLSSVFTYYILDELMEDTFLNLLGMAVVARHHGYLKDMREMTTIGDKDWELLEKQFLTLDLVKLQEIISYADLNIDISNLEFNDLKQKFKGYKSKRQIRETFKNLNNISDYLIFNYIFSILISSDKAEAIFYSKGLAYDKLEDIVLQRKQINADTVDKYRKLIGWDKPNNDMDKVRNVIYQEIVDNLSTIDVEKDRILSINVPTGTGKTLSALSVGLKMRGMVGQNYRLIYALPFTSIIDQNHEEFIKVFDKVGQIVDSSFMIKHHYLTPKNYNVENGNEYEEFEYDVSTHLIESWNSEIIVTTFVQLLHSIFTHKNQSLIKFHNIANSIILLDEIQTIPHKYWRLVKIMLKEIAYRLDCYFVFITATMPLIYEEKKNEIKELALNKENHFKYFDRIELDLSHFREEMTIDNFKEFIQCELEEYNEKSFLIVMNTIKSSIQVYEYINELIDEESIEGEVLYLSTNIIPKERKYRIGEIGCSTKRQIIVSTQMVEAGVNIDLDRVYRDFGPLDSINQTCGRCNRHFDKNKKGVVTLVKLVNENHEQNNKFRSYASYVYEDTLLIHTENLLKNQPDIVKEKGFFDMNKQYFADVDSSKSDDYSNELLEKIQQIKYEQAFFNSPKSKDYVFQLIKQNYEIINLFIEIDEDAISVWNEYQKINKMEINSLEDYSKRQAAFEKIKGEFLSYVITIPEKVAKKHLTDGQLENTFNHIGIDQVSSVYNENTGFVRTDGDIDTFF